MIDFGTFIYRPQPDAQLGDVVQVPRHGRGLVIKAIPYGSPGRPMGEVTVSFADGHTLQTCNHPDYIRVIEDTPANRFRMALEFVKRLDCLLCQREFYDAGGRPLTTPMEVVNAILEGRMVWNPFAKSQTDGTIDSVVEGQPA